MTILLTPARIGGVAIKNRIVMPPLVLFSRRWPRRSGPGAIAAASLASPFTFSQYLIEYSAETCEARHHASGISSYAAIQTWVGYAALGVDSCKLEFCRTRAKQGPGRICRGKPQECAR
jgi:2,4-dienoyl-CoA reductase-like NADH-dependent reductase (Old Yellow Enzyme family)